MAWAQKFRIEEGGQAPAVSSWMLDLLRKLGVARWQNRLRSSLRWSGGEHPELRHEPYRNSSAWLVRLFAIVAFIGLMSGLGYGAWRLCQLVLVVSLDAWLTTVVAAGITLGRVLCSTAIGTLCALPAGLAIGVSPRLARWLQPVIQIAASFPAPMLFPLVIGLLQWADVSLNWGGIVLMLLGTQWYILFNVVAGAMAVPADLREAARSYRFGTWQRFRVLYAPAVFPYLVTGWVTAAGGAWNASIVAEYVTFRGETLQAAGLGGQIRAATAEANYPLLAASVLVMSAVVVVFNRLVWRQLYQVAERRYSLSK